MLLCRSIYKWCTLLEYIYEQKTWLLLTVSFLLCMHKYSNPQSGGLSGTYYGQPTTFGEFNPMHCNLHCVCVCVCVCVFSTQENPQSRNVTAQ